MHSVKFYTFTTCSTFPLQKCNHKSNNIVLILHHRRVNSEFTGGNVELLKEFKLPCLVEPGKSNQSDISEINTSTKHTAFLIFLCYFSSKSIIKITRSV